MKNLKVFLLEMKYSKGNSRRFQYAEWITDAFNRRRGRESSRNNFREGVNKALERTRNMMRSYGEAYEKSSEQDEGSIFGEENIVSGKEWTPGHMIYQRDGGT